MLTSKYPGQLQIGNIPDPIPDRTRALPELLRKDGFRTTGFICNPQLDPAAGFSRGFDRYVELWDSRVYREHTSFEIDGRPFPTAETMNAFVLPWLDKYKDEKFFLFAFFIDPHDPYISPGGFAEEFDPDYTGTCDGSRASMRRLGRAYTEDPEGVGRDIEHVVALYDGEIAYFDEQFGILIDGLKTLGLYEKALIVLLADHGESFFEHGHRGHGCTVYESEARIPLIVKGPGLPTGKRVSALVSMVDLMPTLLDFTGTAFPKDLCVGSSFRYLVSGEKESINDAVWLDLKMKDGVYRKQACITNDMKLIRDLKAGTEELYDPLSDPGETRNLIHHQDHGSTEIVRLFDLFSPYSYENCMLDPDGAKQRNAPTKPLSEGRIESLRSLGYIR